MKSKKLALLRILQILHMYSDIDHPLTQQEIGDITGLSRVSVANAFSLLFQEGALVKGEKSLYITDWEKLQAISRGHEE